MTVDDQGKYIEVDERAARLLAEEALRASDERYRSFIRHCSEGIWRFELEEPVPVAWPEDAQIEAFYRHAYLAECNDALARMDGFTTADAPHAEVP